MSFQDTQVIHSWFNKRYAPEIIDHDTRITALESGGVVKETVNSINGIAGDITLTAGNNISIVPVDNTLTINTLNHPVSDRVSSSTPVVITATTAGTAQTLLTLILTTTYTAVIDAFCSFTIQSSTSNIHDITYILRIGGTDSASFKHSLGGGGGVGGIGGGGTIRYASCSSQSFKGNQSAGGVIITLRAYADTSGVFTVNPSQLMAIGNLIQG